VEVVFRKGIYTKDHQHVTGRTRLHCYRPWSVDVILVLEQASSFVPGDGLLSRESFTTLVDCGDYGEQLIAQVSDTALDGMIISLHSVRIDRANQHFIIGGTDGGTVALWDFKCVLKPSK
jgi:hypothetical protein